MLKQNSCLDLGRVCGALNTEVLYTIGNLNLAWKFSSHESGTAWGREVSSTTPSVNPSHQKTYHEVAILKTLPVVCGII